MNNPPEKEFVTTLDGSITLHMPEWNESYHSKHGAIQEAYHVFIKNGLDFFVDKNEVSILEIGFGTGLNAFITLLESENSNQKIRYTGIEAYPLESEIYNQLNYHTQLNQIDKKDLFLALHQTKFEETSEITPTFSLEKHKLKFEDISFIDSFDLIYFDAFGYRVQPELWSVQIFKKMYDALKTHGILTTYACRGVISRNLKENGFLVKKVPGPIGKREMTLAYKI
jgi:tRNA U34 5-methylaminomethyl-2-thiouridine-forming methyltransferase MnmC